MLIWLTGASATSVYKYYLATLCLLEEKRTYSVDLNDTHIMAIDPEEEHGQCRGIDNPNTIGLARLEGKSCVFVEPYFRGDASRAGAGFGTEILSVLREVDEGSLFGHKISMSLSERTGKAPHRGQVRHPLGWRLR
jgi:hypothetical protein